MLTYGRKVTKAGTILTVNFLVETLPKRRELFYVVGMDNYFTHARALQHCVEAGVHAVGTARAKRGWPPPELKNVDDDRFNSLYYIPDQDNNNFITYRWVDNNIVLLVSTMHDPKATVLKARRRPRTTQTNKRHVRMVWGEEHVVDIEIPQVVDDYNHWKVGVDVIDQLIAYLMCNLRCQRTWIPMMIQALMTMRVNSYTGHKYIYTGDAKDHKTFSLAWMRALMRRAIKLTRATRQVIASAPVSSPAKRFRLSSKNPQLPEVRHDVAVSHAAVISPTQGKCIYCRYTYMCKKIQHPDDKSMWGVVRQPQRKCIGCGVYLCKQCFAPYHS